MDGESPVRVWRLKHNLLQKEVAADMHISAGAYSQKEAGKLGWSRSDLRYFKEKCGLSADYVLGLSRQEREHEGVLV